MEEKFGDILTEMRWMNFGGGHHITRPDYDIPRLVNCIRRIRERYGLTVYLEPGEAVALNAGVLITTVLDIVRNGMDIAVVDASAACHMPDVLEVPYRPAISRGGTAGGKAPYVTRRGSDLPRRRYYRGLLLRPSAAGGGHLVLGDMAIYTMVKNNTFNGMRLPDIVLRSASGDCRVVKSLGMRISKAGCLRAGGEQIAYQCELA